MKREAAAFICGHVFRKERPVLLVCHEGGEWQFLCGDEHGDEEPPEVVGLNHLVGGDPTIESVMDLPDEWEAERTSVDHEWVRSKIPTEH